MDLMSFGDIVFRFVFMPLGIVLTIAAIVAAIKLFS